MVGNLNFSWIEYKYEYLKMEHASKWTCHINKVYPDGVPYQKYVGECSRSSLTDPWECSFGTEAGYSTCRNLYEAFSYIEQRYFEAEILKL